MGVRRFTYLIHRWTGVAACLFMALWFVSGVVMLFIGYPKLTPWEHLGALPVLRSAGCCVSPQLAVQTARMSASTQAPGSAAMADTSHGHSHKMMPELVLTSIRGQPYYRIRLEQGGYAIVDALTGRPGPVIDEMLALQSAQTFTAQADGQVIKKLDEDRWTHSGALNAHRPLYAVQMEDDARTLLYISSVTGQVVMDAPRIQRLWNYAGAWLHWLYMVRDRPADPVWSWTVIVLSAIGTLTAITGTVTGIWRWRFAGRYKSGSRSPYREPYLRWHHICGLLFAGILSTWIFSGLMSMNPFGVFSAKGERPDVSAYCGGNPVTSVLDLDVPSALRMLERENFHAVELEWHVLDGQPYLFARDVHAGTRLIVRQPGGLAVREQWDQASLSQAAAQLMSAPLVSAQQMDSYDAYYYGRAPEAMNGAAEKRLPVLRLEFGDASNTWVYLDLHSGDMETSLDRSQRVGRWLFNFLHSWDLPVLLSAGPWRDGLLILLSVGGFAISATGVVIGYRRLRCWLGQLRGRVFPGRKRIFSPSPGQAEPAENRSGMGR